jgi:hypothetical protein
MSTMCPSDLTRLLFWTLTALFAVVIINSFEVVSDLCVAAYLGTRPPRRAALSKRLR